MHVNGAMHVACTVQQINNTNNIFFERRDDQFFYSPFKQYSFTYYNNLLTFCLFQFFFFSKSRSSLLCMKGEVLPVAVGQHYEEYLSTRNCSVFKSWVLSLSLPAQMMETCHSPFKSVDNILWCDHSNETSLATNSHYTIFLSIRGLIIIYVERGREKKEGGQGYFRLAAGRGGG